jgi:hypothetical protein
VLTELLFFWDHRLRAGPEEYNHCSEVLGGPFGNKSPVNVVINAVRTSCERLCTGVVAACTLSVWWSLPCSSSRAL